MSLLCLDTAGSELVVVLASSDGDVLAARRVAARAQTLLEHVDAVLADAAQTMGDVEAVVVGTGPGGFTGLRVGITTARGIAAAAGLPLFGVGSLVAVGGARAVAEPGTTVWASLDARRGERFAQALVATPDGRVLATAPACALSTEAAAALPEPHLAADCAEPASLARAASQAVRSGGSGDPRAVLPEYVRGPDATPPRPRLRIDDLASADLDDLLAIEQRCFATPWTRQMYEGELERPRADRVCIAARDLDGGARLVGAALAARIGDSWHVMNVLVDVPARRRGTGDRLVEELLRRTQELGEVREGWTLEVRDANEAAIALYERHGFSTEGVRRGYYSDTREDARVMWRRPQAQVDGEGTVGPAVDLDEPREPAPEVPA